MSTNERLKGVHLHRPIIYGSHARFLTDAEREVAPPGHTHKWTVFLTSACTPPPADSSSSTGSGSTSKSRAVQQTKPPIDMDYLPGGKDDLSYLIKKVTIKLHETYTNPNRVIDKPPFKVSETGWGEFAVQIRLQFVAESGEKPLTLTHSIKLHHWGVPLLPAPTPAPAPPKMPSEQDSSVREETVTAGATPVTARMDGDSLTPAPPTAGTEAPEAPAPSSAVQPVPSTEDTTEVSQQVEEGQETKPALPAESSIQSLSLPVHSWQYDELVFYDPLPSFYNLMINHPATPLPVKSKRPRSQRAMLEEDGVKKARVVVKVKADAETPAALSALTPVDAAGSVPPATATASNAGAGDGDQTPIEEQEVVVDVVPTQTVAGVGELSSADIPMEFTQSMEKEEAKRLDEVRIAMIEQMDRWRERLIAKEKELAALREDMAVV